MYRRVLFPVLFRCSYLTNNPYWKKTFEYLSYGISPDPLHLRIYDNRMVNTGADTPLSNFDYSFEDGDIEKTYRTLVDLLSNTDIVPDIHKHNGITTDNTITDWCLIKKKSIKNCLIDIFVVNMVMEYGLTSRQSIDLMNKLHTGILFKWLKPEDFFIQDNNLIFVNGLTVEKGVFKFDEHLTEYTSDIDDPESKSAVKMRALLCDSWYLFTKDIEKEKNRFSGMLSGMIKK